MSNTQLATSLRGTSSIHANDWMKPFLMGVIGLLTGSLCVEVTRGSLDASSVLRQSRQFQRCLVFVLSATGFKLTGRWNSVLLESCRGQDQSFSVGEKITMIVDRAALSGLNVLLGLLETMRDFDDRFMEKNTVSSILSFVRPLIGMDHVLAIKRLKYVTSYWFAKMLHDELPEKDVPTWDGFLFIGSVRRYLRQHMLTVSGRTAKFFYSLLQCKRACDTVPESFILAALEKHRKAMAKQSAPLDPALKHRIEQCTDEIVSYWTRFRDRQCEPSQSAAWEAGRCSGGQHRALVNEVELAGFDNHVHEIAGFDTLRQFKDLRRNLNLRPDDLVAMLEVRPGLVEERRGWLMPSRRDMLFLARDLELEGYRRLVGDVRVLSGGHDGQMTAMVATVLEPLKVRCVTKGRAMAYYTVHGVQKWMHDNLRREGVFCLIGQTVNENVIKDFLKKRQPGELLISGDYSAATDNLKIEVTKAIFERILLRIYADHSDETEVEGLIRLCRKVLYEHDISYPGKIGKQRIDVKDVHQETGQLMGSVLSFPILCLANCICCWLSLYPDLSFRELPILVNGDDISFSTTPSGYKKWSADIGEFGFIKSIGKNYCHRRFMMINSELYDSEYEQTGRCHLPYFKSGLLLGRSKVAKDEKSLPKPPVIVSLDLCLEGSDNPERTLSRFMTYHLDGVRQVTGGKTNLFLPVTRGGFGLSSHGCRVHVSLWQRRYAAFLAAQTTLRTSHYQRTADEAKQWLPTFRIRDDQLVISPSDYSDATDIPPPLIDANGVLEDVEPTWLPALSPDKRKEFLHQLYHRSQAFRNELRSEGPPGWKMLDVDGVTAWKTILSGSILRKVAKCVPLSGDLTCELPYRFSRYAL